MMFKGLDWLPPGDVTLADYARAMLAADRFHHPERPQERICLVEECVRRWIASRRDLAIAVEESTLDVGPVDRERLVSEKSAARRFVSDRRELLGVPAGPFKVESQWSIRSDLPMLDRSHLGEAVHLDREYQEATNAAAGTCREDLLVGGSARRSTAEVSRSVRREAGCNAGVGRGWKGPRCAARRRRRIPNPTPWRVPAPAGRRWRARDAGSPVGP